MKTNQIYFIRRYLLFFLFCINFNAVYSQLLPKHLRQVFAPITPPLSESILQNCFNPSLNGCNYVRNNPFQPNTSYDPNVQSHTIDPFNFNGMNTLITDWEVATGTPTVWSNNPFFANYPQPPANLNYFFGGTGFNPVSNELMCESVVQKIPTLSTSKTYALSFLKMYKSWLELPTPSNTDFPLYSFRIVLMRCQDYNLTFLPPPLSQISNDVPTLPAISQTIYCEINVYNPNWQEVFLKFTPDYNYDLMWIFPSGEPGLNRFSGLLVTRPELIDITNFSAGNTPAPTSNCNVLVGPSTPNCYPSGAVFTWHGPNNQTRIVPDPNFQQILVNATDPLNIGSWTLSMTMPNAVVTNSTCGIQQPLISASVNIVQCVAQCVPAQILPTSYLQRGIAAPQPITPNTLNVFCIPWEDSRIVYLYTNNLSNNLWYIDDVPIPSTGFYANIGWVQIINNTSELVYYGIGQRRKYQVKNLSTNCLQLSPATYLESLGIPYPDNPMGLYKPNFTMHISAFPMSQSPYNEIYSWNIPGTIITNLNPSTGDADVFFPSTIPIPLVTGTISITNSPYCNGTYNIYFDYNPNAFSDVLTSDKSIKQNVVSIYPNPASGQITIASKEPISFIEISDLMNPVLKRIKVNKTKSTTINISDLNPGIYNCKITTTKGVENKKLIIKR